MIDAKTLAALAVLAMPAILLPATASAEITVATCDRGIEAAVSRISDPWVIDGVAGSDLGDFDEGVTVALDGSAWARQNTVASIDGNELDLAGRFAWRHWRRDDGVLEVYTCHSRATLVFTFGEAGEYELVLTTDAGFPGARVTLGGEPGGELLNVEIVGDAAFQGTLEGGRQYTLSINAEVSEPSSLPHDVEYVLDVAFAAREASSMATEARSWSAIKRLF